MIINNLETENISKLTEILAKYDDIKEDYLLNHPLKLEYHSDVKEYCIVNDHGDEYYIWREKEGMPLTHKLFCDACGYWGFVGDKSYNNEMYIDASLCDDCGKIEEQRILIENTDEKIVINTYILPIIKKTLDEMFEELSIGLYMKVNIWMWNILTQEQRLYLWKKFKKVVVDYFVKLNEPYSHAEEYYHAITTYIGITL